MALGIWCSRIWNASGVIQFIYFRANGEAGLNPNPNSDEYKIKLRNISLGIIVLVSLIVLSGLLRVVVG